MLPILLPIVNLEHYAHFGVWCFVCARLVSGYILIFMFLNDLKHTS